MSKVQFLAAVNSPIGDAIDALGVFGIFADADVIGAEAVVNTRNFVNFESHLRVLSQLQDPRLIELANQLNKGKLLDLANSPN